MEHEDSEGCFGAQWSLVRGRHRSGAFGCVDQGGNDLLYLVVIIVSY